MTKSTLLLCLAITGCMSVPVSTMVRMSTFDESDFVQLNPDVVRVKIKLPQQFALNASKSWLGVDITSPAGVHYGEFKLDQVSAEPTEVSAGGGEGGGANTDPVKSEIATGTASFLTAPKAIAFSPRDNFLYVADGSGGACGGRCIWQVNPTTGAVNATPVVVGSGSIEGISFDSTGDNLYFSDRQNRTLRLTYSAAAYGSPAACNDSAAAGMTDPYHLVFDATLGLLVVDDNSMQIVRLATCAATTTATPFTAFGGGFDSLRGIAQGPTGDIFVSNVNSGTIYAVDRNTGSATLYSTLNEPLGLQWLAGASAYADSLLAADRFSKALVSIKNGTNKTITSFSTSPLDVTVDSSNATIYVLTDVSATEPARVYKITGF